MNHSTEQAGVPRSRVRLLGAAIGLLLFAGAIAAVIGRGDALAASWQAAKSAPLWLFVALAGSIALGPVLTGLSFFVLTRRFGRVGRREMIALIASSTLLNYLPLWPGTVSRVVYHRAANGIRMRDSTRVAIQASLLSGLSAALLAVLLLTIARPLGVTGVGAVAIGFSGAAGAAILSVTLAGRDHAWRTPLAVVTRSIELANWAMRYALALKIVGGSIDYENALAMAAVVRVAMLVPISPNGVGVREWAIGLTAVVLADGVTTSLGLTAGLLDRALEVLVVIPLGILCAAWLAQHRRDRSPTSDDSTHPHHA